MLFINFIRLLSKKMDFKFTVKEKLKTRYCFKCNKPIDYGEFYHRNFKSINEVNLIQFWENENLEYYCCSCYDNLMKKIKLEDLRLGLNERDRDILRILELKLSIKIPIVSELRYNTIGVIIKNGNIVGLSLFKCLSKFPEEITMLGALEKLNLCWNSFEFISESISSLTSLKFLDLIGNNLGIISNILGDLTSLLELDLSFNKLRIIPKSLGNLTSLEYLNLIHNDIIEIPESLIILEERGLKILL